MLPVIVASICDPNSIYRRGNVLLDSGAQISLIKSETVRTSSQSQQLAFRTLARMLKGSISTVRSKNVAYNRTKSNVEEGKSICSLELIFAAPYLVRAKIGLQELWQKGLE